MQWISWAGTYHARREGRQKTLCGLTPPTQKVTWPGTPSETQQCKRCNRKAKETNSGG